MEEVSRLVSDLPDEVIDTDRYSEPKKSILEQADSFDTHNITHVAQKLRQKDPLGAYEHLKNSGLYDTHAIIQGYAIIYSWIWEEVNVTDAMIIEEGIWKRFTAILERLRPSKAPEYEKVMAMLDGHIQSWFLHQMIIVVDRQSPGDPLPSGLENFPKRLPKKSPLGEKIENIRIGNR